MVYPDLAFLLSLLAKGGRSEEAGRIMRTLEDLPLALSIVHRLQVENSLVRFLHGSDAQLRDTARESLLMWRHYLHEEVFVLREFDLPNAFSQAAAWNAESQVEPPRWHLLIHAAIAATESAVFMSLDPALRHRAKKAGLRVVPEKL